MINFKGVGEGFFFFFLCRRREAQPGRCAFVGVSEAYEGLSRGRNQAM